MRELACFGFLRPLKRPRGARINPQRRPSIKRPASPRIMRVGKMKSHDLQSMSTDELWSLYERVGSVLARRLSTEKSRLEQRLRELGQGVLTHVGRATRAYPKVVRSIGIPSDRPRLGRVAGSSHAGLLNSLGPGRNSTISKLNRLTRTLIKAQTKDRPKAIHCAGSRIAGRSQH